MCGIAGIFESGGKPAARESLERMASFLKRRGPDHTGFWIQGSIGLAHTRLSIIDLSPAGNQPMVHRDGSLAVTQNGEIYNYKELRADLEGRGGVFASTSDTEVLLEGYRLWGIEELLRRIDGMYAFALVDTALGKAYLCRDPFGKKPLYYASDVDRFLFASDVRSIAAFLPSRAIDLDALDYYLSELSVPQPASIWRGVKQVRPGHYLLLDLASRAWQETAHWTLPPLRKRLVSYADAEAQFEEGLSRAVMKRTVSDVPVGAFLSGGTDSGLVVALLAARSSAPVRTFSIGFEEDDFSELPYARALARRWKTEHTEIVVRPDVTKVLPEIVREMGEPFGDPGAVTEFIVSREAGRHVRVALSGDGGDELFGYPKYTATYHADTRAARWRRRLLGGSPEGRRLLRGMGFSPEEKRALCTDELARHSGFTGAYLDDAWRRHETGSLTDTLFRASLETRLLNDYLVKVDRASMMNSVEIRSPFLDRDLVPLALDLPNEFKFQDGRAKYLLRKLAQKHVDRSILDRGKRGFGLPLRRWLAQDLRPMVEELLGRDAVARRGLFRPEKVAALVKEHVEEKVNHARRIWALICLELWFRTHAA